MASKAKRKVARTSLSRSNALDFGALVAAIRQAHEQIAAQASRAVNISLTLRNWVIGCYIREYEQRGADRGQYGQDLLDRLSQRLQETGTVVYHPRELRRCREFYGVYPRIRGTLSLEFDHLLPPKISKSLPIVLKTTAVAGIRGVFLTNIIERHRKGRTSLLTTRDLRTMRSIKGSSYMTPPAISLETPRTSETRCISEIQAGRVQDEHEPFRLYAYFDSTYVGISVTTHASR